MKTYGTVEYVQGSYGGKWVIKADAHVMIRLKRALSRIDKSKPGYAQLQDTPENAADLLWFISRFPMEVKHQSKLQGRVAEYHNHMSLVSSVASGAYVAPAFDLAIPIRPYQQTAAGLLGNVKRMLLGDDVGLGKTATAIAPMCNPSFLPAVFVTMNDLPVQVKREIGKFAPHLRVYIAKTGQPEKECRTREFKKVDFPDVIIIPYSRLLGWSDILAERMKYLILDEIQEISSGFRTDKGKAARAIAEKVDYCLGVSATPIRNYGAEMWNVYDVISPYSLGTREEFLREWCIGSDRKASIESPESFGEYLRDQGLLLRRTREEVGRELPPISIIPHYVDADRGVLEDLSGNAVELARRIVERNYKKGIDAAQEASDFAWRLRHATGVAKAPYVAEFLRMLIESGERVLVYGWHHDVYAIWKDRLREYNPALFTGHETADVKQREFQRFIDGDTPILISSLRSGAGLDGLQYANVNIVVFGELDWSPTRHTQCIGRIHRDGQALPISAYFLLSDESDSCDPFMQEALRLKKMQSDPILDPGRNLVEQITNPGIDIEELARRFLVARGITPPAPVPKESKASRASLPKRLTQKLAGCEEPAVMKKKRKVAS